MFASKQHCRDPGTADSSGTKLWKTVKQQAKVWMFHVALSIAWRWKKYSTTANLPRRGRPLKVKGCRKSTLIMQAAKRSIAQVGKSVDKAAISLALCRYDFMKQWQEAKPLLNHKIKKSCLQFTTDNVRDNPRFPDLARWENSFYVWPTCKDTAEHSIHASKPINSQKYSAII